MENKLTKLQVEFIYYVAYAVLCFSVFLELGRKGIPLSFAQIMGICLAVMLFYVLLWTMMFFAGHLASCIYYQHKKLGKSPVLFYPMIFCADKGMRIHIFWNFFRLCDYYYPSGIYALSEKEYKRENVLKWCQRGQTVNFVVQAAFWFFFTVCFILKGYLWVGISGIISFFNVFLMGWLKTDEYHGYFVRSKYMKQSFMEMYVTRYAILYTSDNLELYRHFENHICAEFHSDFQLFCFEAIKHMYMIRCVNQQFIYPKDTVDFIYKNCFLDSLDEYQNMDVADEKLNLMKACVCYAIVADDVELYNLLRQHLRRLSREEELSLIKFNVFWNLLCALEEGTLPEEHVLRRNQFYLAFPGYRDVCGKIAGMFPLCKGKNEISIRINGTKKGENNDNGD